MRKKKNQKYRHVTYNEYVDMFTTFLSYKQNYVSLFRSKLQTLTRKRINPMSREEILNYMEHYMYDFKDNFFLIEMFGIDENAAVKWYTDVEKGCFEVCQEIIRKYHIRK